MSAGGSGTYLAPEGEARAELREKGSRFLAVVLPVADEKAASDALALVRERYPDATHHCWAYRLGEPARERSSDDGEPAGTAGAPMARVLAGRGISDVLAVVVRWFGGTKLGKGGLARAYGSAVGEALAGARLATRFPTVVVEIECSYERLGAVKRLVRPPQIVLEDEAYADAVRLTLRLAKDAREQLVADLADLGVRCGDR